MTLTAAEILDQDIRSLRAQMTADHQALERKYRADQLRVAAGGEGAGEFAYEGGGSDPDPPLGTLSKHYESGQRGPGTISTGVGDIHGGVSYGTYQFATKKGVPQQFLKAEGSKWAAEFKGQAPGSQLFSETWKMIAQRDPAAFEEAQHAFIKRAYYDVQVGIVRDATGFDLRTRSNALQQAVWSTAVQHGPETGIVTRAVKSTSPLPGLSATGYDRHLIEAIYSIRIHDHRPYETRYKSELADALTMLDQATKRGGR